MNDLALQLNSSKATIKAKLNGHIEFKGDYSQTMSKKGKASFESWLEDFNTNFSKPIVIDVVVTNWGIENFRYFWDILNLLIDNKVQKQRGISIKWHMDGNPVNHGIYSQLHTDLGTIIKFDTLTESLIT